MTLLIRDAELPGLGLRDVRIRDGRIAEFGLQLEAGPSQRIVDAGGGALVAGLIDHHLHLYATAAARSSLSCAPRDVPDAAAFANALRAAPGESWIRGHGFHDSVCPLLDRRWLDAVMADRPVRIQHQSGMLWILNTRAMQELGIRRQDALPEGAERLGDGSPSGRFFGLDGWLRERGESLRPDLGALSAELARYGITAVTDTGANNDHETLRHLRAASAAGVFRQRVLLMGNHSLDDVSGQDSTPVSVGPLKIYLREADLPSFESLVERIRRAHDCDRAIAAHCATRVELLFLLAALDEAGAAVGDRVEHASVADQACIETLARLGVTVVTQPHFIRERGDGYLDDVDAEDIPLLYLGRSFLDAGVALAAGSDSPYGSLDPWASMRAATARTTLRGSVLGADECLVPVEAFALFGGEAKRPGGFRPVSRGDAADLCLLRKPWRAVLQSLDSADVRMTLCSGEVLYDAAA